MEFLGEITSQSGKTFNDLDEETEDMGIFRRLRSRNIWKTENSDEADDGQISVYEAKEAEEIGSNPVCSNSHDKANFPTISVSSFGPRPSSSSFPIHASQGVSRCDAKHDVIYDCGMTWAHKAKLGVGRGIAPGIAVETPLKNNQSVSKSRSNLPAQTECFSGAPVDSSEIEEEELELLEQELRLRRLRLGVKRRNRPKVEGAHQVPVETVQTPLTRSNSSLSLRDPTSQGLEDNLARLVQNISLPKLEMERFSGSPLTYHYFMRSFEVNVSAKLNDDFQRLNYLISLCDGAAKEAIKPCVMLPNQEGYKQALGILRSRYGKPHDVVQAVTKSLCGGSRIKPGDIESLRSLCTEMRRCLFTLEQLGRVVDIESPAYLIRVIERLPLSFQERWAEIADNIISAEGEPSFRDLLGFVEKQASVASNLYGQLASKQARHSVIFENKSNSMMLQQTSFPCCVQCGLDHSLQTCETFLKKQPADRIELLKKKKLCFVCLRANHRAKECRTMKRCSVVGCGKRHHYLIHVDSAELRKVAVSSKCEAVSANKHVFLGCVPVRLVGPSGSVSTYAFIDNGSDTTLIRRDLASKLGCQVNGCMLTVNTVNGSRVVRSGKISLRLQPLKEDMEVPIDVAYTVPSLPISVADDFSHVNVQKWPHLKGVEIDTLPDRSVGILIGYDVPEAHSISEQRIGVGKQPHAVKSIFGWVLRGPSDTSVLNCRHVNYVGVEEESLTETLARFFEVEFKTDGDSEDKAPSLEDRRAVKIVECSTSLEGNNFVVGLPWRVDPTFDSNLKAVRYRLMLLRKRLSKDDQLHTMYNAVMKRHLAKGYASTVDKPNLVGRWFLPHHPVLNPNKPGKVRVVFDCAATFNGISLNKSLLSGPDIVNDLMGVLMRFRRYSVAICADVEEMFLQVKIPDKDKKYFSFLWWPDGNLDSEPVVHQLNVHPFGATSSPFCATFALRKTAQIFKGQFSEQSTSAVYHNFYVDDCLASTFTIASAVCMVDELRRMLSLGGFKLTKWNSNRPEVLQGVPSEERCTESHDSFSMKIRQPTLGMRWNVRADVFELKVDLPASPETRRGILSVVASLFDPLGLAGPVTLKARQLLQKLCEVNLGWDAPIPEEFAVSWRKWLHDVQSVSSLRIPRWLGLSESRTLICELHVFSDASDVGYSAVSYLRMTDGEKTRCVFLMGKSRVTPKKITTLPRMELVAAVLSAKLMRHVFRELRVTVSRVVMWSDSTIVLHYLTNTTDRFATFVANRVNTIRQLTEGHQWRHVPTHLNPADVGSRGSSLADSNEMKLWLDGPKFLLETETSWPVETFDVPTDVYELSEERKVLSVVSSPPWHGELFSRFSCWIRLLKCVAWLLRFKRYMIAMKGRDITVSVLVGPLSLKELTYAKCCVVRLVQEECFGIPIRKECFECIKRLNPVVNNGILCLGGRVQGIGVREKPLLMPSRHSVTNLIIRYYHETNGHVGAVQVLSLLREEVWIVKGMAQVKRVIRTCPKCKLLYAKPISQVMAPLPMERTCSGGYPFQFCGVDYFGPFRVRFGRSDHKRYGCLFTCLQTRAVHIEVAHSMSTDSFLMSLLRFCNRRGSPQVIFSDNGTNFVGAESELAEFLHQIETSNIGSKLLFRGIEWRFNPACASHRGGVWERIIRSVRRLLSAVIQEQLLSEEVLLTSLSEVERILNERPLTPVYDDPDALKVLRPVDLLILKSLSISTGSEVTLAESYKKGWRQAQLIANTFWKRWIREYLPTLQTRSKWTKVQRDVKVGDVVLIVDQSSPRGIWKRGLVVSVLASSDNHPRTVELRTMDGYVRKDIRSICLLEGVDA